MFVFSPYFPFINFRFLIKKYVRSCLFSVHIYWGCMQVTPLFVYRFFCFILLLLVFHTQRTPVVSQSILCCRPSLASSVLSHCCLRNNAIPPHHHQHSLCAMTRCLLFFFFFVAFSFFTLEAVCMHVCVVS